MATQNFLDTLNALLSTPTSSRPTSVLTSMLGSTSPDIAAKRAALQNGLANLAASGQYTPQSSGVTLHPFQAPDLSQVLANISPIDTTMPGSSSASTAKDSEPWYMKAMTGLSSVGKLVTDPIANWTDGKLDWKDIPEANNVWNGLKGQGSAWKDMLHGNFGWGDIPGFGFAYGIGKDGKSTSNILDNLGWNPDENSSKLNKVSHATVGLLGDILLDPTTYLTFGAGAATKVGKAAEIAKASELLNEAGVDVGSKALKGMYKNGDFSSSVADLVKSQYSQDLASKYGGINDTAAGLVNQRGKSIMDAITQHGNEAKLPYANNMLSWKLPFVMDKPIQIMDKPGTFANSSIKIGDVGSQEVDDLLNSIGLPDAEKASLLKDRYGVGSANAMSVQHLDDLRNLVANETRARSAVTPGWVDYNKFNPEQAVSGLQNSEFINRLLGSYGLNNDVTRYAKEAPDILSSFASKLEPMAVDGLHSDLTKAADIMGNAENTAKWVDNLLSSATEKGSDLAKTYGGKFIEDITKGQKSNLGRVIDAKNPFNSRTFRSADEFVNHAANYRADALTKIAGQSSSAESKLQGIANGMKDLTANEKKAIIYHLEGEYPKGFSTSGIRQDRVNEVANQFKSVLDEIGQHDTQAGTVNKLLQNYFPHVLNPNTDKILNDETINGLLGKSQANQFSKERKGFDTIAQWENAIAELQRLGETDKANELAQLYKTDPMEALGNRMYKSIRSSAFKDLFSKLEADGLMGKVAPGARELTAQEAGAMGLEKGTLMHQDIIKGMTDLHDLFTVDGMNKFMRTVNALNNIFKGLVTTISPAHYWNNFLGNTAVGMMAGVKTEDYARAMKLLKNPDSKLMKEAIDRGVVTQGFVSEFGGRANKIVKSTYAGLHQQTALEKLADKVQGNKVAAWMRGKGDNVDNLSRLAMFISGIRETSSVDKAATKVRKYLFNYGEQTSGDRFMKSAIPFWTWTKNNVPLMVQSFVNHQGFFQGLNRVRNTLNSDVENKNNPMYKSTDYWHIPGTNAGVPMRLPTNDLGQISDPASMLRSLMSMTTPYFKDPIEIAQNKQLFNGVPISKGKNTDAQNAAGLGNYLLNQTGAIGKTVNGATNDQTNILEKLRDLILGKFTTYK